MLHVITYLVACRWWLDTLPIFHLRSPGTAMQLCPRLNDRPLRSLRPTIVAAMELQVPQTLLACTAALVA